MSITTPKSDAQFDSDVLDELMSDPIVDEKAVGVQAHDAIVTLSGSITAHPKKVAARAVPTTMLLAAGLIGVVSVPARAQSFDGLGFLAPAADQISYAGDPSADVDGSGSLDSADFFAFLDAFLVGCV